MKKLFLLSILGILLFAPPLKAQEIVLTLDEALSLAVRNNRSILLKAEDVLKAKAKIKEAQAGLLPSLDLAAGWQDLRELYSKDVGTYSAGAGITQTLYASGKVINAVKISEYNYFASQAVLDTVKLDTIAEVKKAFYTLGLSEQFAEINKGIVENTREHIDFMQARFEQGQSSESEIIAMRSSLVNAQQAYEVSLNQKEAAEALLINLLSFDKEVKIRANDPLICEPKDIAYEEAFLEAMQRRPEIRQLEAQQKSAKRAVSVARSGGQPSVLASWDYYSSSRTSFGSFATPGGKGWNDYNMIAITASWPIFDGWLTKSKVDQALIDLKEAQLLKDKKSKDIALEIKSSYLDLKSAVTNIKSTEEQVRVFKDGLFVMQAKYSAGTTSLLDLHDAKLSHQVALFNQVSAQYDYLMAKARFDRATGG